MRIKVTLSEADIKKGIGRVSAKLGYKSLLFSIVAVIAAGIISGALQALFSKQAFYKIIEPGVYQVGNILLLLILIYFIYKFLLHYSPVQYSHPDGSLRAPREISIDAEGVRQNSQYDSSLTRWKGIMRIEEDKEFIFLYVDAISAYLIPKHCFSSPEEAAAFAAQARDYREAALKTAGMETPAAAAIPNESVVT